MNAFGNAKPVIPSCFHEKVKADLIYDTVKKANPVDFKALKEAKADVVRWRRTCEIFISESKKNDGTAR